MSHTPAEPSRLVVSQIDLARTRFVFGDQVVDGAELARLLGMTQGAGREATASDVLTTIAGALADASENHQNWEFQQAPTCTAGGQRDGGMELHVRIAPPGQELSNYSQCPLVGAALAAKLDTERRIYGMAPKSAEFAEPQPDLACHAHCHRKAQALGIVSQVARLMDDAADRMQHWDAEFTPTVDAAGMRDGGHTIKITIRTGRNP